MSIEIKQAEGYGHTKFLNTDAIVLAYAEYDKNYGYGIRINNQYSVTVISNNNIDTTKEHNENITTVEDKIRGLFKTSKEGDR